MKLFITCILALSATTAFAVPRATQNLKPLLNPTVVINGGGGLAAVQPTVVLKFEYGSCTARAFEANLKKGKGDVVYVQVIDTKPIDCTGMPKRRSYSVQLSSNYDFERLERYVLLNPLDAIYEE